MGHFYNPHQPSQGPTNSTPPIPHATIPPQGDQPPRRQAATAMMMVAVLASWPADLEPRLQPPNNQRVQSAQNIPPPPVVTVVPYTRPPYNIYALNDEPYRVEVVSTYVQTPSNPDPPPRQSALSPQNVTITQVAWQPDPPTPQRRLPSVVGVFPASSQPQPQSTLSALELVQIVNAWTQNYDPQSAPKSAWNAPVLARVPYSPPPASIWRSWDSPDVRPPDPVRIAPLTLVYGDAPAPRSPLSVSGSVRTAGTWEQTWESQSAPDNAGWNVPPILISLPHIDLPKSIWTSWEPAWVQPPRPVSIAPLTLTYGTQPQPKAPLALPTMMAAMASWQEAWSAQTAAPQASWNVPPILVVLPRVELPRAIWTAWEPPFVAPPRPVSVAPLTLSYGAQPTPQAPLSVSKIVQAVAAWTESWPAQSANPSAGWNVPPVLVVLPRVELPRSIWTSWEPPWIQPPQPVSIAPLTLPSAVRPTPQKPISVQMLTQVVSTWEKIWGAQHSPYSAAWDVYVPVTAEIIEKTGSYIPLIEKTGELDVMARTVNYGGDETLFIGEDKILDLEVLNNADIPVNVAGMMFRFVVRLRDNSSDPVLLNELATVVGVYNGIRAVNTQRVRVTLTATMMNAFDARAYRHSWKRMDTGSETVTARGDFYPQRATANTTPV